MRTIDNLASEFGVPDVLFIDVDGFEGHALKGASFVLSARPDCYMEVHSELLPHYGYTAKDVVALFSPDEFDLYVSGEMKPSVRKFVPLSPDFDMTRGFHLVAIGKR